MCEWFVKVRKEKEMSQKELADFVGVSQQFIAMIETGDRRPSVEKAQIIADKLNFDWQLFFPNPNGNNTA